MSDEIKLGHIYILTNEAMPDLVKIGTTKHSAAYRARQLSRSTGVPIPFEVLCSYTVESPQKYEALIHDLLSEVRVNKDREFFKLTETEARIKVEEVIYGVSHDKEGLEFIAKFFEKSQTLAEKYPKDFGIDVSQGFNVGWIKGLLEALELSGGDEGIPGIVKFREMLEEKLAEQLDKRQNEQHDPK